AYDDADALARFGGSVDIATYEFENIAAGALGALAERAPLYPPRAALEIAQDRVSEKQFVRDLGGRPAPFAAVADRADLDRALDEIGAPAILKTRRFGYDGKGQARIMASGDANDAWDSLHGADAVLEGFIAFDDEFSVILCRSADGDIATWEAPRNVHRDGVLDTSTVPAPAHLAATIDEAKALAHAVADALDYVGVLTLEFFAGADGPVFNEMAPRVHNSGHWTIEGALTSQFENHIRAICGLPLGSTARTAPEVRMRNLIGSDADDWQGILADRSAHLHLYGKDAARAGRKMGHVTRLIGTR
ncbi:MAG: 5-(carboxyamino)imidazole ribonucleotide synthase, partial [Pseudomonadota bacterium]|nr:5-(carboxyamino)imidazole ribonucleotide synthase [Pseudomonadota bacterium]